MKIKYLGTAAAEAVPAFFCTCKTCMEARKTLGKDVRSRTQTLINDDLIIDYPPDTFMHITKYNIDLYKIHHFLITHVHEDHFLPEEFDYVGAPGAKNPDDFPKFHMYASDELIPKWNSRMKNTRDELVIHTLNAYEPVKILDYEVTPIKARHSTDNPFNYFISDGEKTIAYLIDTGLPFDETYDYIKKNNVKFDMITFDCTAGALEEYSYYGHLCLGQIKKIVEKLKEIGAVTDKTVKIVNHFSHNGLNINYEENHEKFEREGYIMTYDGMEINI